MNTTDKANELMRMFNFITSGSEIRTKILQKTCALKCVEEIMKIFDIHSRDYVYWLNVKNNIEEL